MGVSRLVNISTPLDATQIRPRLRDCSMLRMLTVAAALVFLASTSADTLDTRPRALERRPRAPQAPSLLAARKSAVPALKEPAPVSLMGTVIQIVNNVAGAGILTLSAGMAGGVGSVPATLLCVALGIISGWTFHLIGASCELTGQMSFKSLWAATLGEGTAWIVDASIALMCFSAAIIYAGILGDTSTQLLSLTGIAKGVIAAADCLRLTSDCL